MSAHASFVEPHRAVALFGIEPGMHIADFGAGSGVYTIAMGKALAGSGHVYAIDVQQDLLRRIHNEATRQHLEVVGSLWADIESVGSSKLADSYIDIVLISNLLFQVEHKDAVLFEAARIVKPRGKVIVIDWTDSPPEGTQRMGPHHSQLVSKDSVLALAYDAGLKHESDVHVGGHHYGIVLCKHPS